MNKSEAFIQFLADEGRIERPAYDKVTIVPFSTAFQEFRRPAKVITRRDLGYPVTAYTHARYDPAADFDYAAMASCAHDGTQFFIFQLMYQIASRLEGAETYYVPAGEPRVKAGYDMTLHYTVGDFVIFDRFGESPDTSRPFLRQHTTVFLPIAYELTYEDQTQKTDDTSPLSRTKNKG